MQQQQQGLPQLQQMQQQQPQAAHTWQQARPGLVAAAPGLPTGVSFLPAPPLNDAPQAALASLAPLALQISAANLAGVSQPLVSAAGGTYMNGSNRGVGPQLLVSSLPASLVLSGVPVGMSQPVVSSVPATTDDRREA